MSGDYYVMCCPECGDTVFRILNLTYGMQLNPTHSLQGHKIGDVLDCKSCGLVFPTIKYEYFKKEEL